MDPIIIDLTTKVMAVLLPFVSKSAEEFASKVGEGAYEKAKALLATLKQKWSGDKETTDSLALFEKKPERYASVVADILQEKLAQDNDLVSQMARLLQDMGPALEIIQKMEEGKYITGFKAGEMIGGQIKVTQEMKKGENVVGADVGKLG